MGLFNELVEGLKIIHSVDPMVCTGAEHDLFYVYSRVEALQEKEGWNPEHSAQLEKYGFHWDDDVQGWAYFT